jgi:uncharacterized protein (TIGR03437 family)
LRASAVIALLVCRVACADTASRPLAIQQTSYEIRAGEPVQISATPETLEFLLTAKSMSVTVDGAPVFVAGRNHARNGVLLAIPARTSPGQYTATLSATSPSGEERVTTLAINVKPRQTVPSSGNTRPPVVLLNGWETGFTGECTVSTSSADTFGNLAQYLVSDGVPAVYFFDNCVEDPNDLIEGIGNALGTYLNTIKFDNGDQVPQIDLVAFSMGGLIARAYLADLQSDGTATPPTPTLVRDLILIATPNFGSFVAGNYVDSTPAGTQSAELVPASSFLWNLATWNQRGDDLRGVNAMAIVGNAGIYLPSLSSTTQLNNASDGLVSETSASVGFALPGTPPTVVVPYCHVDPTVFTNTTLGTFDCNAAGIANVTSDTQETGEIVRSFLAGTPAWLSVGTPSANDPYLSIDGGIYFAMQDSSGAYATDLTAVTWGGLPLTVGGDTDTVYYTDFVSGTGDYQASSTSLGTHDCGTLAEPAGYFTSARCKIVPAIYDVGPLNCGPGRIVSSGSAITITGDDFETQCSGCQVLATPVSTGTQTALQVSSWTNTSITAMLPASISGLVTIQVTAVQGIDAITIVAAAPGTITGASNAASFQPGLASAGWVTLCGSNFSASTQTWGASNFVNGLLPTSLGGISVTINSIPAYVEYISPSQINVLAPDDPTTGSVPIQVSAGGQTSNTFAAYKQQFAPAFFTFDSGKYVAAQHSNYSYVGATTLFAGATPAAPGETVLLYGTGFGPTNPALPTANQITAAEPLANNVTVTIGGVAATVVFAGQSGSGLDQLNVTVPPGLASGDAPIAATIGGIETQTGLYITIQ